MKLAIARAGLGFFGIMLFIMSAMNSTLKDKSLAEQIVLLLFCGFVVGGAVFFWTWYELVKQEHEIEYRRRLRAASGSENDEQS